MTNAVCSGTTLTSAASELRQHWSSRRQCWDVETNSSPNRSTQTGRHPRRHPRRRSRRPAAGPGLIRFTGEIQRTVNPDYHWYPWSHHRKFPPITQWIMDQIDAIRTLSHLTGRI
jgi:hypothetical protein